MFCLDGFVVLVVEFIVAARRLPRIPGGALLLPGCRPATATRAQAGSAHAEPPCNAFIPFSSIQFNSVRRAPAWNARRPWGF